MVPGHRCDLHQHRRINPLESRRPLVRRGRFKPVHDPGRLYSVRPRGKLLVHRGEQGGRVGNDQGVKRQSADPVPSMRPAAHGYGVFDHEHRSQVFALVFAVAPDVALAEARAVKPQNGVLAKAPVPGFPRADEFRAVVHRRQHAETTAMRSARMVGRVIGGRSRIHEESEVTAGIDFHRNAIYIGYAPNVMEQREVLLRADALAALNKAPIVAVRNYAAGSGSRSPNADKDPLHQPVVRILVNVLENVAKPVVLQPFARMPVCQSRPAPENNPRFPTRRNRPPKAAPKESRNQEHRPERTANPYPTTPIPSSTAHSSPEVYALPIPC